MIFTFNIFLNMLFMLVTYVLLCHTAIITVDKSGDNYIFKKDYVFGDILILNDINSIVSFFILLFLCVSPITWVACVTIWVAVVIGYIRGVLDVFGKNKIIY